MIVYLNKSPKTLSGQMSMKDFMDKYFDSYKGLAVAVDNQVVPKSNWLKFNLKDNQHITVIKATQGG